VTIHTVGITQSPVGRRLPSDAAVASDEFDEPPTASTLARAPAEIAWTLSVSLRVQVAVAEDLHPLGALVDEPASLRVSRSTVAPASKLFSSDDDVDRGHLGGEGVAKPALRQTALDGRLTALERHLREVAGVTGLLALLALARGLAEARAHAATLAGLVPHRPTGGCRLLRTLAIDLLHGDEVDHLLDHPTERRGVVHHDLRVGTAEPEAPEGLLELVRSPIVDFFCTTRSFAFAMTPFSSTPAPSRRLGGGVDHVFGAACRAWPPSPGCRGAA
jgi:hypothetical protein